MNLKKLIPELVEGIKEAGFDVDPRPIQTKSVSQIKSGADLFIVSGEGTGKSVAILIGVIQQLKAEFEDVPRAVIMAPSKEKVFELEKQFELLAKRTSLRVFSVFDEGVIQYQKDMIYEGLDVLIGTPKRLNELLKINGIPLTQLKMFVVDDLHEIPTLKHNHIHQLIDSVEKSQIIMTATSWNNNFENLAEKMKGARVIQ